MGPLQDDPLRDDAFEGEHFEGHRFPSEAEWLQLGGRMDGSDGNDESERGAGAGGTAGPEVSSDFVDRTMRALFAGGGSSASESGEAARAEGSPGLPAELLRAYAAPAPSIDFVTRTVTAVRADRLAHWRELLARYVAPEPSPEFVARTLTALTAGRRHGEPGDHAPWQDGAARRSRWLRRAWPLLAIAAALWLWYLPWSSPRAPLELRVSQHEPAAYAYSHAATPLPAVLASLHQAADPGALGDGGADGVWLLLGSKP